MNFIGKEVKLKKYVFRKVPDVVAVGPTDFLDHGAFRRDVDDQLFPYSFQDSGFFEGEVSRWNLLQRLLEEMPSASGEEILLEFLDEYCEEVDYEAVFGWCACALRSCGFSLPTT